MRVDDLNAMALTVGVICRHRPMSEKLAVLQVKMSANAGMAKLVNLGTGMDLARVERCKGFCSSL